MNIGSQEKQYEEAKQKIDDAIANRSRTFLGMCKNDTCYNTRRDGSAYCQACSDKFNNK